MIDVAVAAEDVFGVPIPDEDVERFETIGDAVDYIQQARVTV
jgi:acyl carrier protein